MPLVEVEARFEYVPGRPAFEGRFEAGEGFTVVVGPNGAGKTTLLHLIAGVAVGRLEGRVSVLGADPYRDHWVKRYIALARQEPVSFGYAPCTVREALRFYALMKGEDPGLVDEVAAKLGLTPYMSPSIKVPMLSFGTRRKLEVAKLMLSPSARVYLLDELIGLDPPAVRAALDYLSSRVREGACAVVVTHDPRHLQLLSGRVAVLRGGRVLRLLEPHQLKRYLEGTLYEVTVVAEGGDPGAVLRVRGVEGAEVSGGPRYVVRARCRVAAINEVLSALMGSGARIHRVEYDEISPLFEP